MKKTTDKKPKFHSFEDIFKKVSKKKEFKKAYREELKRIRDKKTSQ